MVAIGTGRRGVFHENMIVSCSKGTSETPSEKEPCLDTRPFRSYEDDHQYIPALFNSEQCEFKTAMYQKFPVATN
jgi:hypothetical protein